MISSSRLAELQHVPAWKFCAAQSQERFDRENAQRADRRKWKTTARPRKTLPGSPDRGREKNKRGRNRAVATRKDREEGEALRGFLHGVARVLQAAQICNSSCLAAPMGATSCGQHVGLRARVVVLEGHERAHQSELGFEQQNRFRNSREIQRIDKKAFRARADAAQSARRGGTEPTRFRDGRRTTGPPAPRRGPGAPTAQPRPRGPDLESAQI